MPVSSDGVGIYIIEESVFGVVPASPVWLELPILSESLATNATTTTSNTLNPERQVLDNVLTGIDVSGNLEIEVARTPALDLVMESIFAEDIDITGAPLWTLNVGILKKSFAVMKKLPDPASPGDFIYHIYKGCIANTLTMSMSAGSEVTASIAIVGKETDADTATIEPALSTYPPLASFIVLRAPEVQNIVLDNVGGTLAIAIGDSCVTDMTLTINGNVRGIQCLGTLGNKEVVMGRFEATLAMTIFFNTSDIMEEFLEQNIIDAAFTIGDDTGSDHYAFVIPKGKIASETVVAGGTNTDVVNALVLQALLDNTETPPTSVIMNTRQY